MYPKAHTVADPVSHDGIGLKFVVARRPFISPLRQCANEQPHYSLHENNNYHQNLLRVYILLQIDTHHQNNHRTSSVVVSHSTSGRCTMCKMLCVYEGGFEGRQFDSGLVHSFCVSCKLKAADIFCLRAVCNESWSSLRYATTRRVRTQRQLSFDCAPYFGSARWLYARGVANYGVIPGLLQVFVSTRLPHYAGRVKKAAREGLGYCQTFILKNGLLLCWYAGWTRYPSYSASTTSYQ
jgi:hypothetical protein